MQMRVYGDDDRIHFQFAFRHVAVDGLAAVQFISDLLVAYGHLCLGHLGPPPWRQLNPEQLRDRDGYQLFGRKLMPIDFVRMAKVHLPLSLRQAALVSNERSSDRNDMPIPTLPTDYLVRYLTEEETTALGHVALKQSVMLNDLLVRDYLLMLADWNRGTSQAHGPLRIRNPDKYAATWCRSRSPSTPCG